MGASWQDDKAKTDKLLPSVKRILGQHLITTAPFEEDAKRNTDLIVLSLNSVRIGLRIRDASYWMKPQYRDEFTIRCSRPSGTKTELDKIIDGWGDYFFYGFANPRYTDLLGYMLGNLNVFRSWRSERLARNNVEPGFLLPNRDESSEFRVYKIADLPHDFVVTRYSVCETEELMNYLASQKQLRIAA